MSTELSLTIEGEGPTLVCLHGGPGLADYMSTLGAETDGWRRVCWTQRGVLPSTTKGPLTLTQHVADTVGLLDHLGLDDAVLLGHSWGGFLGAAVAAAHPTRVRGLVLVDSLGVTGDGGFAAFAEQMIARTPAAHVERLSEIDARLESGDVTDADFLESFELRWPAYFADPTSAPPPSVAAASYAAYVAGMADVVALLGSDELAARAASYAGPVEVVFGAVSPMPAGASWGLAAAFTGGVATAVPGAGHFPWLETPGCVAAALARVAARL